MLEMAFDCKLQLALPCHVVRLTVHMFSAQKTSLDRCPGFDEMFYEEESILCPSDMFFIQKVILLITVNAFCALLILAFACWHVNMLTSMLECSCTCVSARMACASLHEACQHHPKVMPKRLGARSWSIGESSARGGHQGLGPRWGN